jgi:quinol monooxygenase YgiN
MPQTVKAVFPCQPGKGNDLVQMLSHALADTRAFPGCLSVETYTDVDQPDTVVLWEKFETRADHEAYLKWRGETGMMEALAPILAGPLDVQYLDFHDV